MKQSYASHLHLFNVKGDGSGGWGALGTEWVEGDGGAWDWKMGRGRWVLLGQEDGYREMGTLGMGGWVEGDGCFWDGKMDRGRWELLGQDDG